MAVEQLQNFTAGEPESLRLLSLALQYSLGFLAKGLLGIREMFWQLDIKASEEAETTAATWAAIVREGLPRAEAQ